MRRQNAQSDRWKPIHPGALALIGLLLLGTGATDLFAHRLHYANVWGAPVFVPFVIVGGVLALAGAVRLWTKPE